MNFGRLFVLAAAVLTNYSTAASNETASPTKFPIYNGRPNNGGYPYPAPTPQATTPETRGPYYYGRPNGG
ncbi:hypothetical protein F443_00357, partial [Phytophthora nicotianae P1569]